MKIVALDFETANSRPESACALGISIYEDGVFLETVEWKFRPHSRYNYFTNTFVHGIRKEDVQDLDEFLFFHDRLSEILDGAVIAAHNALFDLSVLNAVCDLYGLEHYHNPYVDTVTIARRVYPECYDHKLNTMADYLCIDLDHHHAGSDSFACLMILLKAMEAFHCYEVEEFMEKIHLRMKNNS